MQLPTLWLFATTILGESDGVTVGLAIALCVVAIAWGEARVHISGLREWKKEAQVKIDGLERQAQDAKSRADLQGQQINHILQLLTEMREDVKSLVRRGVA
jgi:peptidoglycan hydrolase CwlO-like protein